MIVAYIQHLFMKLYNYLYMATDPEIEPLDGREPVLDEADLTKIIYYYRDPKLRQSRVKLA